MITNFCSGQFPRHKRDFERDRVYRGRGSVQRGLSGGIRLPADLLRARAESFWGVRMQQSGTETFSNIDVGGSYFF